MTTHPKPSEGKKPTWEEEEAKLDAVISDLDSMEDFTDEEHEAYKEFLKGLGV
ncbi:MAG: hypothetical protein HC851_23310 [Acaryochloris sp. RU_4_1]|nr:hypothetical protein [Acaryochloris sp. RU_4_1]